MEKNLRNFSSRLKSLKSFTLTIRWNVANPAKIYHGIIVLPHLIDLRRDWDCRKSGTQNQGRNVFQYQMKNVGLILRNATAFCEMAKDLLAEGKTRHGEPFKGPIIPFGAMVEYFSISANDQSGLHQFGKTVLPGIFLGYAFIAGRNLERRYPGGGHREAGELGTEIHAPKAQCKGNNNV